MLIRIFGITTPLGDQLYKKVLKNLYANIFVTQDLIKNINS